MKERRARGGIHSRESAGRTGCVLWRAGSGRVEMWILLWVGKMSRGYTITSGSVLFTVQRCKHTQVVASDPPMVPDENEAAGRSKRAYEVEHSKS